MNEGAETRIEERGISAVDSDHGPQGARSKLLLVALVTLAAGAVIALTWQSEDKRPEKAEVAVATGKVRGLDIAPVRQTEPLQVAMVAPVPVKSESAKEDDLSIAARRAPVMAYKGQARQKPGGTEGPSEVALSRRQLPASENALQSKLTPTPLEGVRASRLADLHMSVPQGTHIPCVLETAISSDQPGFVTCVIQRDVLSASGQVVLMEKGTQVTGEYQNGIEQGQGRIFVLWSRARTPTGVIVALASPATDALGRAGFDGEIDNKFWDRFGGALLLSVVQDAVSYGASLIQQTGGSRGGGTGGSQQQIQLSGVQSSASDAAAIAVENSIDIKPTLYKNQGEIVAIFVARDLDFSSVYQLRRTEPLSQIYDRAVFGARIGSQAAGGAPMVTK